MKKTMILLIMCALFTLQACKDENKDVPNGLRPIQAVNDCDVPTLKDGWVCVWADEFAGETVDEDKWTFEIDGQGGGNNELQYYRKENATIVDGKLVITARKEAYGGRDYTSARLVTRYKGDWRYARIVVSAKLPSGRGTWPAIWMLPTMNVYGNWPNSGELDIMEYVGYEPDVVHTTIHTRKFNHTLGTQIGTSMELSGVESNFYEYEAIWKPGNIKTYADGEQYGEFSYQPAFNQDVDYDAAFPFDQLQFLILNLAIGGNWGGVEGVDDSIFPTSFEIDYVRIYQLDYATLDKEAPSKPENISIVKDLPNSIFWSASDDDVGVERYAIYVDGAFKTYSDLNQIRLSGLETGRTYGIQIEAEDFVGRTSGLSDTFSFTYR
jgi:beta-glucanase (GH16 family)